MCNYLTAAYIFLSNAYQWILIAVLSAWYVISSPQSFWNVGMWFQPVWNILGSRYSSFQPCQRALTANSDSYFGQITAKLLQNFCFEPPSVALCWVALEFMGRVCPDSFVNACGIEYVSTFEIPLHQGVLAFGRRAIHVIDSNNMWTPPVLSVLRKSMTSLLYSAWGPNPPHRELRLCRLFSSIAYLSTIHEDYKYHVLQPFENWGVSVFLVMILILVGMLAVCAVQRKNGPKNVPLRSSYKTRSRVLSQRVLSQPLATPLRPLRGRDSASSVPSMVSPVVPQADDPGASSEQSVADPVTPGAVLSEPPLNELVAPSSAVAELAGLLREDGFGIATVADDFPLAGDLGVTSNEDTSNEDVSNGTDSANGSAQVSSANGSAQVSSANGSGPVASAEGIANGSGPAASAEGADGSGPVASADGIARGRHQTVMVGGGEEQGGDIYTQS
jgi:hypothetical protein